MNKIFHYNFLSKQIMNSFPFKYSATFIIENKNELEKYHPSLEFWNDTEWFSKNCYEPWISIGGFSSMCECKCFYDYFMSIKRNELKQIDVLFCENVFDSFINVYFNGINTRLDYAYKSSYYDGLKKCNLMFNNSFRYEDTMTTIAMLCDKEFAYTQFYNLHAFQMYEPFMEYKINYEERKERLLMVYEETYNNWQNNNNTSEMVFSNEYLIIMILKFL